MHASQNNQSSTIISKYQLAVSFTALLIVVLTSWINMSTRLSVIETKLVDHEKKIEDIYSFLKQNQLDHTEMMQLQMEIKVALEGKENREDSKR